MRFEYEALDQVLTRHGRDPHALVQILRQTQALTGWLSRKLLDELARELTLALAQVEGVAGFYRFFHTRPVGRYRVLFSDNITDHMRGSVALMADLIRAEVPVMVQRLCGICQVSHHLAASKALDPVVEARAP